MSGVEQGRSATSLFVMAGTCMLGAALSACEPQPVDPHRIAQPLIGGETAPDGDPGVLISHRDLGITCSGVLIARRLVVTARHCIYDARADAPLAIEGVQVSFGPARDQGTTVNVVDAEAAGPMPVDLSEAVAAGRDVALLWLASDAPAEIEPLAVEFDYTPRLRDAFYLTGFGLSSAAGTNGKRLRAAAALSAEEASTGILQLSGAVPCYGDSGGPAVLQRRNALVGVLGQIAVDSDAGTCGAELAFVYSVRNPEVRALLLRGCAQAGGCGAREDAGAAETAAGTEPVGDSGPMSAQDGDDPTKRDAGDRAATHDGGTHQFDDGHEANQDGCGCCVPGARAQAAAGERTWALVGSAGLMIRRRRRKHSRHHMPR